MKPSSKHLAMVEEFQCPGCACGHNTQCGAFEAIPTAWGSIACGEHVVGTMLMGIWHIALGLPKGFCKTGTLPPDRSFNKLNIRLFTKEQRPMYDKFNVPVWALEQEGYLFVRCYSPRSNVNAVDVIEGGKINDLCPGAADVGTFLDEID